MASFPVVEKIFNAFAKLLAHTVPNAGFVHASKDLLFHFGRLPLDEFSGFLFSAADQIDHKLEPCRFGLCK